MMESLPKVRRRDAMYDDAIRFSFPDPRSAFDAFDTLQELGYSPVIDEVDGHPTLHIHVEHSDVRSALEIVQVHGGELMESAATDADHGFDHPGGFSIPAHTINEDFTDSYVSGTSQSYLGYDDELVDGYRDSVYE
jgi:hypothetical protein